MVMRHHSASLGMNTPQGFGSGAPKTICIDRKHLYFGSHIVCITNRTFLRQHRIQENTQFSHINMCSMADSHLINLHSPRELAQLVHQNIRQRILYLPSLAPLWKHFSTEHGSYCERHREQRALLHQSPAPPLCHDIIFPYCINMHLPVRKGTTIFFTYKHFP